MEVVHLLSSGKHLAMKAVAKIALTSMLGLGLMMSASACSPKSYPVPSASSTASSTASATPTPTPTPTASAQEDAALEASKVLNAFMVQLKADTKTYQDTVNTMAKDTPKPEVDRVFSESFAKSNALIKPNAMTEAESKLMTGAFAALYLADPATTITADPAKFEVAENVATIRGGDMTVIFRGAPMPSTPEDRGGKITLENVEGEWLISKFSTTG